MNKWRYLEPDETPPKDMEWEKLYDPIGVQPRRWMPVNRPAGPRGDLEIYRYRPAKTDADKCWEAFGVGPDGGSRRKGTYWFNREMFDSVFAHVRKWDKEQK